MSAQAVTIYDKVRTQVNGEKKKKKKRTIGCFTCTMDDERNPNISSPLMLCRGCDGNSTCFPRLFCLFISSFTLCKTISQHLSAEILEKISPGCSSNETWIHVMKGKKRVSKTELLSYKRKVNAKN